MLLIWHRLLRRTRHRSESWHQPCSSHLAPALLIAPCTSLPHRALLKLGAEFCGRLFGAQHNTTQHNNKGRVVDFSAHKKSRLICKAKYEEIVKPETLVFGRVKEEQIP